MVIDLHLRCSPLHTTLEHLISAETLSLDNLKRFFALAEDLLKDESRLSNSLANKVIAILFFQPSTRTRLGFERACLALGGKIIGFDNIVLTRASDSTAESINDTIRVVSELSDLIVIRHFVSGVGQVAAQASTVPVVNAGDGSNEHPTQAISDAWIMQRELCGLNGKIVGIVGDPGSRVLRSLVIILSRLKVGKILFLIPPAIPIGHTNQYAVNITLPPDILHLLNNDGTSYDFRSDVIELLSECDAMEIMPISVPTLEAKTLSPITTANNKSLERFLVTRQKLLFTQSQCLLLHPGPRGDELNPDTDTLPNSFFFKQVKLSRFIKMAVLHLLIHNAPVK